jgi:hypothetical protein
MKPSSSSTKPTDPFLTFPLVGWAEPSTTPAVIRLRRLLKALLRGYGFRALEMSQLPEGRPDAGPAGPLREGP